MNKNFRILLVGLVILTMACVGSSGSSSNSGTASKSSPTLPTTTTKKEPTVSNDSQDDYYTKYNHTNYKNASVFKESASNTVAAARRINAILFFMVNEQRASRNAQVIPYHETLEVAAYYHSLAMAEGNFFDHQNPKTTARKSTADRAKLAGVANPYIAENIVYVYADKAASCMTIAEKMMESWLNSSGHKKNILSKESKNLGCGVYFKDGKWYGTQVFQWFYPVQIQEASDKF